MQRRSAVRNSVSSLIMAIFRRGGNAERRAGLSGVVRRAGRLTSCDSEAGKAKEAKQGEEESAHGRTCLFWHVECAIKMKDEGRKVWGMSGVSGVVEYVVYGVYGVSCRQLVAWTIVSGFRESRELCEIREKETMMIDESEKARNPRNPRNPGNQGTAPSCLYGITPAPPN